MATSRPEAEEPSGADMSAPDVPVPDVPRADVPSTGAPRTDVPQADVPQTGGDAVGRVLAEPGQRLVARIIDTLIVGLPVVIVVRELVSGGAFDLVAPPAVAGCLLVYEAVQLSRWGRTPGKRAAGIEVVRVEDVRLEEAEGEAAEDEAAGSEDDAGERAGAAPGRPPSGSDPSRLGALRGMLRAALYSVPIVARPVPVLGVAAGVFWVANAGLLFEGRSRQALHDRLAGTVVVKRPDPDSTAF